MAVENLLRSAATMLIRVWFNLDYMPDPIPELQQFKNGTKKKSVRHGKMLNRDRRRATILLCVFAEKPAFK